MNRYYQRVDQEQAYILHSHPYSETSLMVEAFTPNYGRIICLAKGAKRPYSVFRGALQSFQPLVISWSGRSEVKTLRALEWQGGIPLPRRDRLLMGFYLNELLLKSLPREDAYPALFSAYHQLMTSLGKMAEGFDFSWMIRKFEIVLLRELGYALNLETDGVAGVPLQANQYYQYQIDQGAVPCTKQPQTIPTEAIQEYWLVSREKFWSPVIRGETLLALGGEELPSRATKLEAGRLMRQILNHYLDIRQIASRKIWRDLLELETE